MNRDEEPVVRVRLATPEDAATISSVLLQAFAEYKPLYTPAGFDATTPGPEDIHNRMAEGPVWVALVDETAVATVSAVPQSESLYVRGMGVLPAARGYRIGELLMRQVETFAASRKCARLFLSTTPFLHRAIALYERLGFSRTANGPHDLYGTPLFTMEKMLE
ncbi:MAG TPA: GNAT family N-acetyltransferase [Pyrinomonadaceae bacterium]|jgi:ribosomal protein S18 acetylase RimI-like enzyme|nr:GNAT family N-acetyltransferase [Pyrinomonadaceae bacterium]